MDFFKGFIVAGSATLALVCIGYAVMPPPNAWYLLGAFIMGCFSVYVGTRD